LKERPGKRVRELETGVAMERHLRRAWRLVGAAPALLWGAVLALLGLAFLWRARGEISAIGDALRTAHLRWLIALLVVAALCQALNGLKLRMLLRRLGCDVPYPDVMSAQLQRTVILTVVPAGSAPAAVLFARRLGRFGVTAPIMVMALLLVSVLGHASFITVLIPAVLWISLTGSVSTTVMIAAILLTVVVLVGGWAGLGIMRHRAVPAWAQRRLPHRVQAAIAEALETPVPPRALVAPYAAAVMVDLLGIGMVWMALQALDAPSSLRIAVSGYVIGTHFLMIAPIFQGIGIVEITMALALERAGVARADAFAATLLYRVGEVWTPLAVGVAIQIRAQEQLRRLPRNLPALMTGATGLLSVLSVMAPQIPARFNRIEDYAFFDLRDASRTFSLVAGALLLALSLALVRRRQVAWWSATGLLGFLVISHLFKRHDQIVAVIAAVNLVVLLITRRRFRVRSDVPTMRRGVALFAGSLVFALAYGTLGFWLLDRREFNIDFSIGRSLKETLYLFFSLGGTDLDPRTRYADWFLDSVSVVGVISLFGAVVSLLRPVVWRRRTLPHERAEAEALIAQYGRSALDEFKVWPDKLFFFGSDRQSVISYGVRGAVAVALGDPVAANEASFQRIVTEFLDFCDANAWRAAFHQVGPEHVPEYRTAGLVSLKIGEDAIVDLTGWSLSGNAMKPLRGALNRIQRAGNTICFHAPPLPDDLLAQLREVSSEWLRLPGRRERGFTLGQWDDAYIRRSPVFTATTSSGRIVAFINLVRDGVPDEGTFDLMRHRPDAPNGAMDALLVRLAEHLRDQGCTRLSLGMVPFADVGTDEEDPVLERALRLLVERMERFFSYRGLRLYKEKFHPIWEPRYLVYQSGVALPQIVLAIIQLTERESLD
jgi:phosphatidylglycerol lysyltransferase